MSSPTELSFDEILKYMLAHNGKITNYELVKHFKVFLMDPNMKDEARNTFKKHVNTLAIIKNQNNEKWLILKKKYMPNKSCEDVSESTVSESPSGSTVDKVEQSLPPYRPPPPIQLNQDFNILTNIIQDTQIVATKEQLSESKENIPLTPTDDVPPKVYPRKKSSASLEKRSSISSVQTSHRSSIPGENSSIDESLSLVATPSKSESMLIDNEQKISVKERKQMFNRMASESDVLKSNKQNNTSQGIDEEDRVSLAAGNESAPLDSRQKQWVMCAARGDYHALAKMCRDNPRLVKTKDPFTTALHWASKRGDEDLLKLLAGTMRSGVHERSGYTPAHIAMQFRHENVYKLLIEVYDADPEARDWSGRKPRQYLVHTDLSLSPGSYRKPESLDRRRTITSPPIIRVTQHAMSANAKKESFLRIGSLNVRVKKTTEAFSNFLGYGAARSSAYVPKTRDRRAARASDAELHKSWGSADNVQKEGGVMPPPASGKVKRRGASARRGLHAHSRSTPSTPDQPRAQLGARDEGDSDSDSAAGFHAAWRQQRASCA